MIMEKEKEIKVYQVKDVAKLLEVSERTVWNWIRSGRLESVKIGGVVRVTREQINKVLNGEDNE